MKLTRYFLLAFLSVGLLSTVDAMRLRPGEIETFAFPDQPQTLWSLGQSFETKKMPAVTVRLPDNYTKKREFPLVVFIGAARGGSGHDVSAVTSVVGTSDFICVSLPLFKNPADIEKHKQMPNIHELAIEPGQTELLWSAYAPMLEKVFQEVPNIDRTKTFFGGFSNGAHATAALLNHPNAGPGLREYVNHFYFVEGGHFLQLTMALPDAELLFMQGEQRAPWLEKTAEPLQWNVRIGVEVRTMPGIGHAFPGREKRWLRAWIRKKCGL